MHVWEPDAHVALQEHAARKLGQGHRREPQPRTTGVGHNYIGHNFDQWPCMVYIEVAYIVMACTGYGLWRMASGPAWPM